MKDVDIKTDFFKKISRYISK